MELIFPSFSLTNNVFSSLKVQSKIKSSSTGNCCFTLVVFKEMLKEAVSSDTTNMLIRLDYNTQKLCTEKCLWVCSFSHYVLFLSVKVTLVVSWLFCIELPYTIYTRDMAFQYLYCIQVHNSSINH